MVARALHFRWLRDSERRPPRNGADNGQTQQENSRRSASQRLRGARAARVPGGGRGAREERKDAGESSEASWSHVGGGKSQDRRQSGRRPQEKVIRGR